MFKKILLFTFISLTVIRGATANVVIGGTRVIYPESEKNVTVKIKNPGSSPVLIQSWIDDGDPNASPEMIKVPFLLTPPINRIDPEKGQTLRISYTGEKLPEDRESIFWLNVLEVPPIYKNGAAKNNLQIALRTRIKIFFRPAGLTEDIHKAMASLKWRLTNNGLEAKNNSPYYVNLADILIHRAGKQKVIDADNIAPFNSATFALKGETINKGDSLTYDYINDWGALTSVNISL